MSEEKIQTVEEGLRIEAEHSEKSFGSKECDYVYAELYVYHSRKDWTEQKMTSYEAAVLNRKLLDFMLREGYNFDGGVSMKDLPKRKK